MKKFILLFLCLLSMGLFSQEKDFKTVPVDKDNAVVEIPKAEPAPAMPPMGGMGGMM